MRFQGQQEGQSDQRAHALDLLQQCHLRMLQSVGAGGDFPFRHDAPAFIQNALATGQVSDPFVFRGDLFADLGS